MLRDAERDPDLFFVVAEEADFRVDLRGERLDAEDFFVLAMRLREVPAPVRFVALPADVLAPADFVAEALLPEAFFAAALLPALLLAAPLLPRVALPARALFFADERLDEEREDVPAPRLAAFFPPDDFFEEPEPAVLTSLLKLLFSPDAVVS